jgi:hypothetical protein
VFNRAGVQSWDEFSVSNDRRAEAAVIPVIRQHFANRGASLPNDVSKVFDNYQISPTKK